MRGSIVIAAMVVALAVPPDVAAVEGSFEAAGLIGGPRGVATGGLFTEPADVAVYHGEAGAARKIFVVEGGAANGRVQRLDRHGNFELAWGRDVVRDGAPGDRGAGFEICRAAASGPRNCQAGAAGAGAGEFRAPTAVAVDDATGDVYVADHGNRRVQRFDHDGRFLGAWGRGVATGSLRFETCVRRCRAGRADPRERTYDTGLLVDPMIGAIAVSSRSPRRVFLGDERLNTVFEFSPTGRFVRGWGWGVATGGRRFEACTAEGGCRPGRRPEGGAWPRHLAADAHGILYGSESGRDSVVTRFAASGPDGGSGDAEAALMSPLEIFDPLSVGFPLGLAIDRGTGNLMMMRNAFGPAVLDEVSNPGGDRPKGKVHDSLPYIDSVTGLDAADGMAYLAKSSQLYADDPAAAQKSCVFRGRGGPCNGVLLLAPAGELEPLVLAAGSSAVTAAIAPHGVAKYRLQVTADGRRWRDVTHPRNVIGTGYVPALVRPSRLKSGVAYRVRVSAARGPDNNPVPSNTVVVVGGLGG